MSMGTVTIIHQDGREVRFSFSLFHNVKAGHPVSDELINQIVTIMADAQPC